MKSMGQWRILTISSNEAHQRGHENHHGLVVNHTSTDHEWFQQAKASKSNPFRDFYIWKDPKADGTEPTNWQSKFSGNAWKFDETTGQYYLHLFDVTQADLNWENTELREKVYDMMLYWAEKGVMASDWMSSTSSRKDQDFPDDRWIHCTWRMKSVFHNGPRVHEFLKEMNREVLSKYDMITVGESPGYHPSNRQALYRV